MNTKLDDGDQAFPDEYHSGMSLRDYFAAKALQGWMTQAFDNHPATLEKGPENIALASYKMADAMLAAREGQP